MTAPSRTPTGRAAAGLTAFAARTDDRAHRPIARTTAAREPGGTGLRAGREFPADPLPRISDQSGVTLL